MVRAKLLKALIIATGRAGLPLQSPVRRVNASVVLTSALPWEADIRASLQHGCFGSRLCENAAPSKLQRKAFLRKPLWEREEHTKLRCSSF
jgi:hypothetical protein